MTSPTIAHDSASEEDWRFAFRLLAGLELGASPEWDGPDARDLLEERVRFLAWSRGIVPREDLARIGPVLAAFRRQVSAPEVGTAEELRQIARVALHRLEESKAVPRGLRRALSAIGATWASDPQPDAAPDPRGRALCGHAVTRWYEQLTNDPRWNSLPSSILTEPPVPIHEVYVDLYVLSSAEVPKGSDPRSTARSGSPGVSTRPDSPS